MFKKNEKKSVCFLFVLYMRLGKYVIIRMNFGKQQMSNGILSSV